MTKTFTYDMGGESAYLVGTDEIEEFADRQVTVEIGENELIEALSDFIVKDYFDSNLAEKQHIKAFISAMDLTEHLCDIYEDYLYDYFKDKAKGY